MNQIYTACRRAFLLFFLFAINNAYGQYCTPTYISPCANLGATDYIQSFSTTGGTTNITNLNTACGNSGPNYVYYSTMSHTAAPGNTVTFTVVNTPDYTEQFKIWVDWNQDFTFSNTELVATTSLSPGQTYTASFTVPLTATTGTTRMRIRNVFSNTTFTACSNETYGEVEDYNFVVQPNQPCSGTPSATISSSASSYCSPNNVTLTATPGTPALGYTYQWQSSPACANTFTNITGATNSTYNITSLSANTDYRVVITCSNSGLSANSNVINIYPACYGTSAAINTTGPDIGWLQFVTSGSPTYNNPASAPATLTFNSAANATYTNYMSLAPLTVVSGGNSSFTLTQFNSGAYTVSYLKIYADFNRDGDFTDPNEQLFGAGGPANAAYTTFTGFLSIPAGLQPGYTRLRFVLVEGGTAATVNPTGPYTAGETEDYRLFIKPVIAPLTATSNSPICANGTIQLNASTSATCVAFSWTGPNGFTSTLQNPAIPNATTAASGTYTVTASSYGVTATASTNVTVNPGPTNSISANLCNGSSLTFGSQTITTAGTYTHTFTTASGCDSLVTLTVTMVPQPPPPTVSSPVTYCQGAAATALTATGSGLLWYTTTTGGTGSATAPVPSTAVAGTTKYYVSQTSGGCESVRDSITVVVNAVPAQPAATSNSPLCQGATLNLSATSTAGASFAWTGPGGFSSSVSNPSITNVQTTNAGTYTVTATLNGCASAPATTNVVVNPLPVISSVTSSNPTTCGGTNGSITLNGLQPSTSYSVSYSLNGSPAGPVTVSSGAAGSLTLTGLTAGTYTNITVTAGGCTSLPAGPLTLADPATPAAPTAGNNGPLCTGDTLQLTATATPGATYAWTGPGGFSSTLQNPVVNNVTTANAGTYSVTVTINGCTSAPGTTAVVINPSPVISTATGTNPTICNGSNGSITLSGLTPGSAYTINYTQNGVAQTPVTQTAGSTGTVTITGLTAATYAGITATLNGCTSAPAGPVILNNPTAPAAPTVSNNGPLCSGATLNLTASSTLGATYSWTGPGGYSSTLQNPTIANVQTTNAGVYSVTATLNGCSSAAATTTVVVNATPAISSVTSTNPTGCNTNDGTITISGLTSGTSYTVNYSQNGSPATATQTAGAGGTVVLTGLPAGTYSNISVSVGGCTSATAGPVTLTNPPTPGAPAAGSNSPLCVGATLNLTAGTVTGATYTWTGPGGFTSVLQNPTINNVQTSNAGTYSVTVTVNGCTSAAGTTSVVVNPAPVITSVTGTDPSTCNGTNGSITIAGLTAGSVYTINYTLNGTAQTPATLTAGAGGTVVLTGLGAGTYADITATLSGCTSAPAGPVILNNPSAPAAPVAGNNGPLCTGATLNLTATGAAGATYTWTGPGGFSSTQQNPTIANVQTTNAGVYSVTATLSGCTSAAATTTVVVNPTPVISSVTSTNPTGCGLNDGTITISGLTSGTSYTVNYSLNGSPATATQTAGATGTIVLTGLAAGTYSNINVGVGGCTSANAGPVTLTNPPVPATPAAGNNGPLCAGSTLNLTATTVTGATYSWTGPGGFTSGLQNPTLTNAQAANAGTYSVTVTVNGCTSAAGTTTVVVNPLPVIASVTSINPTGCGLTNGSITLTGLSNNTGYTVNYDLNGTAQPAATATSTGTGTLTISNLGAGTYSNITVTASGCTSAGAGPVTLTSPSSPAAPAAGNNGPICSGATLNLTASAVAGATYSWTGPGGFSSTQQNPSIINAGTAAAGTYSVTVTVSGCTSPAGTTTVVINPTPAVTSVTSTNPTTCGGSNGSITLNGLTANTTYNLTYSQNGSPVTTTITSNAAGSAVISNLPAGSYTNITLTLGTCTSAASGPVTLSDPNPPAAPVASSNSPACIGGTLNLTASSIPGATYSWTGPGGFSSALQNPTITGLTAAAAGTYSVTVTVNNCTSPAATTPVTVSPIPTIGSVTANSPSTCSGTNGNITISGLNGGATYTVGYDLNGVAQTPVMLTASAGGVVTIPGLGTGTYSNITVTLNGCASAPAGPVSITNPSAPATPVASNNGPVCEGGNITLSTPAVAGATYSWTGPNGFTSSQQNPVITGITTAGAGNYVLTITVSNCTSQPDTTTVVVYPTPVTPVITGNSPVCEGSPLSLTTTAVPGATYSWTGPNGFAAATQSASISAATAADAGQYSLVVTQNGCTSAAGTYTVVVNPVPAAPQASADTFCQNYPVPALTAAGQNLLWYTSATGGTGSTAAPVPSSATAGIFTWYVSQTVNNCESPRAPVTITIIPQPALPVVSTPVVYCQFDPAVPLTATGQDILWYTDATGGTGSAIAPTPSTTQAGTFYWYVSQSANGCEGPRAPVEVIVHPKPDTVYVPNPLMFCQGDTTAVISVQGQNLTWYTGSGAGSPTTPDVNTDSVGTTIYYVTQTINNCESDRAMVVVVVNENVNADIQLSSSVICQYDTITVSNMGINPLSANYNWDFDGGVVVSGNAAGPIQVRWDTPGNKNINLLVNNFGCTASDNASVTVKPAPTGEFEMKDDLCIGEQVFVQAAWNSLGAATYTWNFADAEILNEATGAGAYKLRFNTAGTRVLSLVTTENGCRSLPHLDTVTVHAVPEAKIAPLDQDKICRGEELRFAVQGGGSPDLNYIWSPAHFFPDNGKPEVRGIARSSELIRLQVVNEFGCVGADSLFINADPCCTVALPDAFTPNNDGHNDKFRIITDGRQQVSVFRVVNRWGQTVFETADGTTGWDGTMGGKDQPMGTYYYYLRYQCGTDEVFEKRGEVTLIR